MKNVILGAGVGRKYLKYAIAGLIVLLALMITAVTLYFRSLNYVATVGNEKIKRSEFIYMLNITKGIVKHEYGIDPENFNEDTFWNRKYGNETILDYTRNEALSYLKSLKVECIKAKEKGVKLDKKDLLKVEKLLEKDVFKHVKGGKKEADEYCKKLYGITVNQLREIYKQIRYRDKLKELVTRELKYDEDDIKTYYDNNPEKFMDTEFRKEREEAVWVRYILVKKQGKDNAKKLHEGKIEEAEKKAQILLEKVKKGEEIKALLEEFRDDKTITGGDTIIIKGQMPEAFEDTAFNKLKPGQISGIVETDAGFYIIKLEEKIPEGMPVSYKAAREYHEFNLGADTLKDAYYQSMLDNWKKNYEIKINKKVFESIK